MKRVISVILAVGMLALSATVGHAAVSQSSLSGNSNTSVTSFATVWSGGRNNGMPCFRPGSTLSFDVGNVTSGNQLTVISSKCEETSGGSAPALSDTTVQYINQYSLNSSSQTISFTIRDQADGLYVIKINDNAGNTANFYYKVGSADMVIVQAQSGDGATATANGTPYILAGPYGSNTDYPNTYSVGFIGKATLGSNNVGFADIGSKPGFRITNGTTTKEYGISGATLDTFFNSQNLELSGKASVVYGMTIYNIPSLAAANVFRATPIIDAP